MVSKNIKIAFRTNCALQIFSIFNSFSSLFWSKLADNTKKHNQIIVFNSFFYGFLVLSIISIRDIKSQQIQQFFLILITIFREFTLGSFGAPQDSLVMNYLAYKGKKLSSIGYLNLSKNISYISAMFYTIFLDYIISEKNLISIKLCTFFLLVCISSFLLIFVAPSFSPIKNEDFTADQSNANLESIEERSDIDIKDKETIFTVLRKKSLILLYISTVVAGLYKCVNINLLTTFIRIRGEKPRYSSICFAMRSIVESAIVLFLSHYDKSLSILFISSMISTILSLSINMIFNYEIEALLFSEIFTGYHRATVVFSTILLFRTYSTSNTQSQVQGLRNSAYNGISCVVFGIIAFFTIDPKIIDPNQAKTEAEGKEMSRRLNIFFLKNYRNLAILLALSLIPSIIVHFLRKRNL